MWVGLIKVRNAPGVEGRGLLLPGLVESGKPGWGCRQWTRLPEGGKIHFGKIKLPAHTPPLNSVLGAIPRSQGTPP